MQIKELYDHYLKSGAVSTDTRSLIPNSIFFALKGDNFNGNEFTEKAITMGCSLAVADEPPARPHPQIVVVKNVLKTLQELARFHRDQFEIPVIGLTGSNGKTTTKELMTAVLRKKYKVHATAGNLNNHIGVPLTLLSMPLNTELAVIEMGASYPDDIKELCEIANPYLGIITNIGDAHLEGFGSRQGVIRAKGQLYDHIKGNKGLAILHTSDPVLREMGKDLQTFTYSTDSTEGDVSGKLSGSDVRISFEWSTKNYQSGKIQTQLTGGYNLPNLLAAVSAGIYFDVDPDAISEALAEYEPQNNRSQIKSTGKNTLIMDAYNANPTSVAAAVRDFASLELATEKRFIIGDMLEVGKESSTAHEAVINLIEELQLEGIFVGPLFKKAAEKHSTSIPAFPTTTEAAVYLQQNPFTDCHILIKGSRGIKLEQLVSEL